MPSHAGHAAGSLELSRGNAAGVTAVPTGSACAHWRASGCVLATSPPIFAVVMIGDDSSGFFLYPVQIDHPNRQGPYNGLVSACIIAAHEPGLRQLPYCASYLLISVGTILVLEISFDWSLGTRRILPVLANPVATHCRPGKSSCLLLFPAKLTLTR